MVINVLQGLLDCNCVKGTDTMAFLEEKDPGAAMNKIKLVGLKEGDLVIMIDDGRRKKCSRCNLPIVRVTSLFKEDAEVLAHKLVDAVILRKRSNVTYDCIYVDLKSSGSTGVDKQFKSTQCLIRYFHDVLAILHDQHLCIATEFFAVIQSHKRGSALMKPTFSRREVFTSTADQPAHHYKSNGTQVDLSELIV